MHSDHRKTTRIMIVEDEELVAQDIQQLLESRGYAITSHVRTGEDAVTKVARDVPDIILMDIKLAGDMDGIEAADIIGKRFFTSVIFLTAYVDDDTLNRAKITDPFGYVSKPFTDRDLISAVEIARHRITTQTEARRQQARMQSIFDHSREGMATLDRRDRIVAVNRSFETMFGYREDELRGRNVTECLVADENDSASHDVKEALCDSIGMEARRRRKDGTMIDVFISGGPIVAEGKREGFFVIYRDIGRQKQAEREITRNYEMIQTVLEGTTRALATAVELRDPYTAGHQHRVTRLACAIADEMKLDDYHVKGVRIAASIHDIGKIHVPAEILSKPGVLTDMEFNIIKLHPRVGYGLLKSIDFPWPIADIIYQHHERLDGSGYPQGLTGREILTESKIIAVADVVEAMVSHRPYRPALGINAALDEIKAGRGTRYDARAVDACVVLFTERGYIADDEE